MMFGKLGLLLKGKLAVAVLGTVLVAGAGTTVALAATGTPIQLPLVSQGQSQQHNDHSNNGTAQESSHNDGQQAEGTVSSIDAGHSSFVLTPEHGAAVTVVVNSQTEFEEGLRTFADLKVGLHVEAKGVRQTDSSLLATKVEGQNANENDDQDQDANENELKGTIGNINVATSTFVLQIAGGGTKTVEVSTKTEFDGGFNGFADLKTGMSVEVRGNLQANGILAATRVHREDAGSSNDHSGDSSSGSSGENGSGTSGGSSSSGSSGSDDGIPHN